MESFRTVIKGWLGKVLLVLFLTPLALVGIEGYFNRETRQMSQNCKWTGHIKKDLETLTQRYKEQYLAAVKGDESLLNLPVIQTKSS